MLLKLELPKITSEAQYKSYVELRASFVENRIHHGKMINELNLRIIQWNCRNDEHNPVQTIDGPVVAVAKVNDNEAPKYNPRFQKVAQKLHGKAQKE